MKETDRLLNSTLSDYRSEITKILSALANEKRMQILIALLEGTKAFSNLQDTTELGKTALSHHLNILVESGVINQVSRGNYELSDDGYNALTSMGDVYAASQWRREKEASKRVDLIRLAHSKRREKELTELEVKIVELEPMRVASFRAVSESPENDAFQKLYAWTQSKGLLDDLKKHPVYGFDNPSPSPGKKKYGYEFWIKIDDEYEDHEVEIKDVPGAKYAVTTCYNLKDIGETWKRLDEWALINGYEMGEAQCLEKAHDPAASEEEVVLDLYLSIKSS